MKTSQLTLGRYLHTRGGRMAVAIFALVCVLFFIFGISQVSALTTVPTKMNFQGRLTDASGNIKPNGTYNMKLRLYTVSSGGSTVWTEDRLVSAGQGVTLVNGLFSVKLGDVTSLPANLFASGELYLEVELPTPASATSSSPVWTEGAMTPRNQMATSAYAYNSETLDGLDSTDFIQNTTSPQTANFNVSGNGVIGGTLGVTGATTMTSPLTLSYATVTDTPTTQLVFGNSYDNLGVPSANKIKFFDSGGGLVGLGVSSFDMDLFSLQSFKFHTLASGTLTEDVAVINGTGITSVGTLQGTRLISTVATGTAPLTVASTTKVANLNVDSIDGLDSTAFAAASGSANYIQNQNASAQATASFWISGTGRAETGILTPLIDSLPGGSLDVGTNAQGINLNAHVIVASDKVILLSGGNTASRIGTAQEGMVYYDTDTKKLIVYSNGKWQADRTDAILVAANDSTQAEKDAADYVADGDTGAAADGDQIEINQALTAGAGKKVVLLPGTYVADAGILVPNNTTLTGVGNGTKIQLADIDVSANLISNSDTTTGTGVTIRDLMLDGQKSLNTAGTQRGVYLTGVGNATDRPGALVEGVTAQNFNFAGIDVGASSQNITINNNTVISNYSGIRVGSGSATYITVSNNTANSNTTNGIDVNVSSRGADVTGNTVNSNGEIGIDVGDNGLVSSNTVSNNTREGINLSGADNNIVSSNYIYNNGGSSVYSGIDLGNSDANQIIGNRIIDTAGTGQAINIGDSGCANNYLADNVYSGTGASTMVDGGTGTIYGGQVNGSGNYLVQPAGTVELMKNTNVTGTLNVTSNVDTNGSLTVGNANQFVISNTGVVTSGTWQGGAIAGAYGGTGQITTSVGDLLVGAAGSTWSKLAIGGSGACLTSNGTTAGWGTCTATNLQGTYNASSPATIDLSDSKNFTINAADTATDSSIVFNLQCTTCSTDGGRFAIQDAGVDIFRINPNGDIILGTAANNMTLTASNGYKPVLTGTARNSKTIRLHAEYPSVVLTADGSNNTGTITSGYDNTSSARMNYYKWTTTQGSNQDYDIVVQVPLPVDFDGWDGANPLAVTAYTSNTTNGTITLEARDSSDAQICNFVSVTPGSTGTWATNNTACTLSTGTYTAGNYMTLRIRLQAPNGGDTRVGNIVLNYKSKF